MFKEKFLLQKDPEGLKDIFGKLAPLALKYLKDKAGKISEEKSKSKAEKEEELKESSEKDIADFMIEMAKNLFHKETPEEKISSEHKKNSLKIEELKKENEGLRSTMLFMYEMKLLQKAFMERNEEFQKITNERKELSKKWKMLNYIYKGHKSVLGETEAKERTAKEREDLTEKFSALKLKQEKLLTIEDWPELEVAENDKREIEVREKPNSKGKINILERINDILTLSAPFFLLRKKNTQK